MVAMPFGGGLILLAGILFALLLTQDTEMVQKVTLGIIISALVLVALDSWIDVLSENTIIGVMVAGVIVAVATLARELVLFVSPEPNSK